MPAADKVGMYLGQPAGPFGNGAGRIAGGFGPNRGVGSAELCGIGGVTAAIAVVLSTAANAVKLQ